MTKMKYNILTPIIFLFICAPVIIETSNILIFIPSPWKSHIISFYPLFLELAHRGHNVTVVTKFPIENPPINYTQVVIDYEFDIDLVAGDAFEVKNDYLFVYEELYIRMVAGVNIAELFVSSPKVQTFIKNDQSKFDLVIVESFFQEFTVAMGHKYGAPVIGFIPLAPWATQSFLASNPSDFSYIKDFKLNSGKSLDFKNRLLNTLFGLYSLFFEPLIYYSKMENLMNTYIQYPGYETRPTLKEMLKNMSLSLIDSDVTVLSPRPYVPSFIEVPGIHLQKTKKMSQELNDFMNNAHKGVVYFNFGSLLNVNHIPKHVKNILLNVLGGLEQKVIFKWINNDTKGFPDNFYVDSWLPQLEILEHPNCKLFITHGGIHSIFETIYAGVPIIGFPIFGDQFQNIKISQENNFGIERNFETLTNEILEKDIKLILTDRQYSENAKRMSSIFRDRPMPSLDKAIYWIEYVIRHNGAHHLRSAATELLLYQYLLLDVIAFIIFSLILIIFIFYFIIKIIIKIIHSLFFRQKKIKKA